MNYQSIISSLIISGALGIFNYTLLVNLGSISSYADKSDRNIMYIIFSILNYSIFLIIRSFFYSIKSLPRQLDLGFSIVLTIVISFILTLYGVSNLITFYKHKNNNSRVAKKLAEATTKIPIEAAFDCNDIMLVYIFDFDNKFITSGYLQNFSTESGLANQFLLEPQEDMDRKELNENDVLEKMNSAFNSHKTKIFLDSQARLKYYIIYFSEE